MAEITEMPADTPTTNALDNHPIQGALIETAFVKFAGSSAVALEDPPDLDEPRTYIVKATCTQVSHALRKDNEERVTVTMDIESVYERGKVLIVDENQGSLFGDGETADDAEDSGEDGDDE